MAPKAVLAYLLALFLLAAPGCWNRRDPELLAIVLGVAFDYNEARGLYQVIAQVANPIAMGGGQASGEGGGSGGGPAFWTVSNFGHTPFEAMQNLTTGTSREFFWAHNRVLLLSEKLVRRRGIGEILDLMERERQFRPIIKPVIVEGDLRRLMEAEFPLEETGIRGIDRMIKTTQFEHSVFPLKLLNEIYSTLEQPGIELFIGKITVIEEGTREQGGGGAAQGQGGESGGETGKTPPARIGGAALFRGDRMVGWADLHQAQGWNYATGRGNRFSFVIECPAHSGSHFSIENVAVSSAMRPVPDGGDLRIILEVRVEGRIQDVGCRLEHELTVENEFIKQIERTCAQAVRNRIEAMISRSQELKSDVLGFGNLVYRKQPKLWREIGERWDEIFPGLAVEILVEYNLTNPGLATDPVGKNR